MSFFSRFFPVCLNKQHIFFYSWLGSKTWYMHSIKGQLLTRSVYAECIFVCYFLILHDVFYSEIKETKTSTLHCLKSFSCSLFSPSLFSFGEINLKFVDSSWVFQPSSIKLHYRPDWAPKPKKLLPLQVDTQDHKWVKLHLIFWCLRDHGMPGISKHTDTV